MIENVFYYWGPLLLKTKVDNYKDILKKIKKEINYNKNLGSHIDETFYYDKDEFKKDIAKQFENYIHFYENYHATTIPNKEYTVKTAWVNFMKAGEYNPPHIHDDDFSCVLYLKIPDLLKKENSNYTGRDTAGPGGITFMYGEDRENCITEVPVKPEEGDMYIFPANLKHVVRPFRSKGTRISLSANFKLKESLKTFR
jgi:hypothetical protein